MSEQLKQSIRETFGSRVQGIGFASVERFEDAPERQAVNIKNKEVEDD